MEKLTISYHIRATFIEPKTKIYVNYQHIYYSLIQQIWQTVWDNNISMVDDQMLESLVWQN